MSYFRGLKLTKRGEELLARVNGNINETITFTAGEIGAGEIESDDEIRFLSSLKDKWGDLTITDIKRTGEDQTIVRIETQFSNIGFTEEKILREIGLYAKGKETEPILFGYSNAYEKFDPIPLPEDNPQSFIIGLNFKVSSSTKIDAIISMGGFVTLERFEDFKNEMDTKISENIVEKQDKTDEGLLTKDKTVVGAINEIEEKFKNFCPFPINSIFLSLDNSNPATLFLGTTWEKQEGRFLLGSGSAYALGSTGGSSTTTLSKENLPNVKLQIDSFSLGKGTQEITGDFYTSNYIGYAGSGAFYRKQSGLGGHGGDSSSGNKIGFQASKSWTGMSTSAAPYTTNMGDSTPFSNMPPYLAVNIWKRLT